MIKEIILVDDHSDDGNTAYQTVFIDVVIDQQLRNNIIWKYHKYVMVHIKQLLPSRIYFANRIFREGLLGINSFAESKMFEK